MKVCSHTYSRNQKALFQIFHHFLNTAMELYTLVLLICVGMLCILQPLPACQILAESAAAHPISPQAQLTDQ